MKSFRERLRDWQDFDVAEYALAEALGLVPPGAWDFNSPIPHKGVFWSNDPLGEALSKTLNHLVEAGVLEKNGDAQFRWRPGYEGLGEDRTYPGLERLSGGGIRISPEAIARAEASHNEALLRGCDDFAPASRARGAGCRNCGKPRAAHGGGT